MKKICSLFLAMLMCVSLSVSALADSGGNLQDETTPKLLAEFKEKAQEGNYSDEVLIPYIGEIADRSSEFSDDELIAIISNNDETANYRRGILETYLSKYDFSIEDERFLNLLQDLEFDKNMKTLIIACLSDELLSSPETKDVLTALVNSESETLAYHAIKALAVIDNQGAIQIAQNIFSNAYLEPDAKVNIALDILANNYSNANYAETNSLEVSNFIDELSSLYEGTYSEEIRWAVENALEVLDTAEAQQAAEYLESITPVPYANGAGGYAVYRDGVEIIGSVVTNWHTAIVTAGIGSSGTYAEASGIGQTTGLVSYNSFLNGNTFKGYYKPSSVSSYSGQRDSVVSTAKTVANLHIPYVAVECITYNSIPAGQTHYKPANIKAIRCDGFVEYCFEYNGIRVYGPISGNAWDISLNDAYAQDVHNGVAAITPKSQAENYMDRVNLD